ncbi:ABC transporter permease [Spiroplasma litorale]|uniref:ABC transporter permease n=1 Tax=Spiroplasma litorale TaxID=216942 RepID=A0A0K1W2C3_9MOLU|nr:ABC transporter permease [Spiroplasma litorale]AKX34479.1 ABC transporter permease [Spiroplasma litorale]
MKDKNKVKKTKVSDKENKVSSLNWLIIKSGIKQMSKSYASVFFIWLLVFIASVLCFVLSLFYQRVDSNFNKLSNDSVLRDFVIDIDPNDRISFNEKELVGGENILDYSNNDLYQQYLVNTLSRKGKFYDDQNNEIIGDNYFNWSRTEARVFNNITFNDNKISTRVIAKTGIINTETNINGDISENEVKDVDKLITYDNVNDSQNPFSKNIEESVHQVVLQANFANKNGIKLNDIVRLTSDKYGENLLVKNDVKDIGFGNEPNDINDEKNGIKNSKYSDQSWFQVIGLGTSIDFFYSYRNAENPIPNIKTEMNAYVSPEVFGLTKSRISRNFSLYSYDPSKSVLNSSSASEREVYFSGKFKNNSNYSSPLLTSLNKEFIRFGNINPKNKKFFYSVNDSTYKNFSRLSIYNNVFFIFKFVSYLFVFIFVFIIIFIVTQLIKRELKESEKKLGTFKALGCKNSELSNFFWILPTLIVFAAVVVGYVFTFFLQSFILSGITNYLNFSLGWISSLWIYAIAIISLFTLTFFIICKLNTIFYIRKDASKLLNGVSDTKVSVVLNAYKKIYSKSRFGVKLHSALFASSFKKVMTSTLIIFISSSLLSFLTIVPFVIDDNKKSSFDGIGYNNVVEYNQPISNNPMSFLKTYNSNKKDDYEFSDDKVINDYSEGLDGQADYYTASPTSLASDGTMSYDVNKILTDLISNDISKNYYSYNIPKITNTKNNDDEKKLIKEISKLGYSNWKNFSTKYLNMINKIDFNNLTKKTTEYKVVENILNQWSDYNILLYQLEKHILNNNNFSSGGLSDEQTSKNIFKTLQEFYIKYDNGIRLSNDYYFDNDFNLNEKNLKLINYDKLIFSSTNDIYNEQYETPNPLSVINKYEFASSFSSSIDNFKNYFSKNKLSYNDQDVRNIDVDKLNNQDLKILNSNIIIWYWINFSNKLGESIIQSFYSHESVDAQTNIKNAFLENKDYNFSYNIVPYDKTNEELGTLLNATYKTNNKINDLKIYGINPTTSFIDLYDSYGYDLKENLFKKVSSSYENKIPIVVNNSLATKFGINVGSTLNEIKIAKKELVLTNNSSTSEQNSSTTINIDNVKMGLNKNHKSQDISFNSEYKKNYYSYDNYNNGWSTEKDKIEVAHFCVDKNQEQSSCEKKYDIAVNNLENINNASQIQNAAWNSEILAQTNEISSNFVIVGIQKSYGEPKAWISNENANHLLGYDKIQKYFFNNFFVNDWYGRTYLKELNNKELLGKFSKEQWEDFVDYLDQIMVGWHNNKFNSENANNPYDDFNDMFLKLGNDYEDTKGYKHFSSLLNEIFKNQYPIFSYKYIKDSNSFNTNKYNSSKTQDFGDFSTIGLYGQQQKDEESGSNIYKDGFAKSNTNLVQDLQVQKDFLNKISQLLNLLLYVVLSIVFIMTFIIIFISSIYTINENSSFIATMKTLGYTNYYIINQVFMIYFIPVLISIGIAFGTCFGMLHYLFNLLSINSSFVVPFFFNYQPLLIVFLTIILIYLLSMFIAYKSLSKISPSKILGDQ